MKWTDKREGRPPLLHATRVERITQVNEILQSLSNPWCPEDKAFLSLDERGRIRIHWDSSRKRNEKGVLWVDFGHTFPKHSVNWPWGGTQTQFIHQLCRWIEGRPCFGWSQPMAYWGRELSRRQNPDKTEALIKAVLPEHTTCVICGKTPPSGLDWWHGDTVVGPICSMNSQKDYCWKGKTTTDIEREKRAERKHRKEKLHAIL